MRGILLSALVVVALATAIATGCGESQPAPSLEEARACLESGGADVVAPPLERGVSVFVLGDASAFVGLPSGGVAAVGFHDTAEDAAALHGAIPGTKRTGTETHGKAVVTWRRPAGEGDQDLLATCLESGGEHVGGGANEPANPLGCVHVYLETDATEAQERMVEAGLHSEPLARQVRFVSKESALARMRRTLPALTKNLHGNPLPDAFEVSPKRGEQAPRIAARLRDDRAVDTVRVSSLPCSSRLTS